MEQNKFDTETAKAEFTRLYNDGISMQEIAERMGMHPQYPYEYAKKLGLDKRELYHKKDRGLCIRL